MKNEEISFKDLTKLQGPNLLGMGSKVSPEWLFNWLKKPHEYMPSTRMPDLRLSDSEARDLTAYLYDNKNYDYRLLTTIIAKGFTFLQYANID